MYERGCQKPYSIPIYKSTSTNEKLACPLKGGQFTKICHTSNEMGFRSGFVTKQFKSRIPRGKYIQKMIHVKLTFQNRSYISSNN